MKKQIAIVGMIVLLFAVGLSGCNETKPELKRFVGIWTTESQGISFTHLEFKSDGTCLIQSIQDGTYEINEDNKLVIRYSFMGTPTIALYNFSFSNNDETLTLIDNNNETSIYIKQ